MEGAETLSCDCGLPTVDGKLGSCTDLWSINTPYIKKMMQEILQETPSEASGCQSTRTTCMKPKQVVCKHTLYRWKYHMIQPHSKVDVPNSVTPLDQTPIFEWHVCGFVCLQEQISKRPVFNIYNWWDLYSAWGDFWA